MKTEKIFWTDYGIFICTKCQKKITMPETESTEPIILAEQIKTHFKEDLNNMGLKGQVRVMTSSCLGVCPVGSQALCILATEDLAKSHSIVFNPFTETESVLAEVKKIVQS